MTHPLAIMDYGIGGLGLASRIKKDYPAVPIIYFSDAGEVPYGKLRHDVLKARVEGVIRFLKQQGAAHVIVACHSASSVVTSDSTLTGIRELTIDSIEARPDQSMAIIGGGRTIRARYYQKQLKGKSKSIRQRIAQPLSILVERGETDSQEVDAAIRKILLPIKSYDRLLLAFTHYPALRAKIEKFMKPRCEVIDPMEAIYHAIEPMLTKASGIDHTLEDKYFTTGDTELMKEAAYKAFGYDIPTVEKVQMS